jgi:hypothetical protein
VQLRNTTLGREWCRTSIAPARESDYTSCEGNQLDPVPRFIPFDPPPT